MEIFGAPQSKMPLATGVKNIGLNAHTMSKLKRR